MYSYTESDVEIDGNYASPLNRWRF